MVYVEGHYRDGYWLQPYYRRPPERTAAVDHLQKQKKTRRVGHKKRVEEAAKLCSELVTESWQETVAGRATDYITQRTWRRLFRTTDCKVLAKLAAEILAGKQGLHNLVGKTARSLTSLLGRSDYEQALAQELASKLPLPWDAKFVAVARGIQITGILICLADGKNLTHCQCFIDLAQTETKENVKKILTDALDDWAHLADVPHPARVITA
jgi:hypothetical protein